MEKSRKHTGQIAILKLVDPAMTGAEPGLQQPIGKIMAWSEDDIVAIKYPGYTGHCGGGEYEYMPSETVIYQLVSCEFSQSADGFSEITTAKALRLVSFPTKAGNYHV